MGCIYWSVRRHAGAEHGTVCQLDHDHGKLRMASVSARWRGVVISISWESQWNSRLFSCGRSSGVGERFTVGYSYRPELSDTVRRRYRLVVSRASLFRYLAGSLVSGAMRRDCVRAGRGRDSPNVLGHW